VAASGQQQGFPHDPSGWRICPDALKV